MKYLISTILLIILASSGYADDKAEVVSDNFISKYFFVVDSVISGSFADLELSEPFGLTKDFKGDVYLSDASNDRILKFSKDLKFLNTIGSFGTSRGAFNHPTFLNFDNGLNLMVSDEGNKRISRYTTDLVFVDEIDIYDEDDPLKFGMPSGIGFTPYGETWVCDNEMNQIIVYNNVGQYDRLIGDYGYDGDRLTTPEKIFVTVDKKFLVADAGAQRLVIYDQYGNFDREIKMPYAGYPIAAVVKENIYWVIDHYAGVIYGVSKEGELIAKSPAILPGDTTPLTNPTDLLVLENGKLLIADSQNNRLIVVKIILNE